MTRRIQILMNRYRYPGGIRSPPASALRSPLVRPHLTNDRMIIYFSSFIPDQASPTHFHMPDALSEMVFKLLSEWKV